MTEDYEKLKYNLITIISEFSRFRRVFGKILEKLPPKEQIKYSSQLEWFSRQVDRAAADSDLRVLYFDGQKYDPGMAVTPLNLDSFTPDDILTIDQTIEPTIMEGKMVLKTGTVLLERKEK